MWSSTRRAWRWLCMNNALQLRSYSAGSWDKLTASKYRPKIPKYSPRTLKRYPKPKPTMSPRPHPKYITGLLYPADPFKGCKEVEKCREKSREKSRSPKNTPKSTVLKYAFQRKVIQRYVPLAHKVLEALPVLEEGVRKLVASIPVKTCSVCMEVHVGAAGHEIHTCPGRPKSARPVAHSWIRGYPEDVLLSTKAFHVFDRAYSNLPHMKRYTTRRLLAIRELCLHAGVDDPEFPMVRLEAKQEPQEGEQDEAENRQQELEATQEPQEDAGGDIKVQDEAENRKQELEATQEPLEVATQEDAGRDFKERDETENGKQELEATQDPEATQEDAEEAVKEQDEAENRKRQQRAKQRAAKRKNRRELKAVAKRTLAAFEVVRCGVKKLMSKYKVWSCGYCPAVHIGDIGHRVHCINMGDHVWQKATLSDVFPPNFVWHVPPGSNPVLLDTLKAYYGQAPAVVELCIQAGAQVPQMWEPHLKRDVVIPEEREEAIAF